jgi:hypothetical protein
LGGASASPARISDLRIEVGRLVASLPDLDKAQLLLRWRNHVGGAAPTHLPRRLLARVLAFRMQVQAFGDVSAETLRMVQRGSGNMTAEAAPAPLANRAPATRDGTDLRPGAMLAREWRGKLERVTALDEGFGWNGKSFGSLSQVAKEIPGTSWIGHRFFGLRSGAAATSKTKPSGGQRMEGSRLSVSHLEARL